MVQSNSQRQVAAAAAKLGLACHRAVYHSRLAPPTPEYETSGNALLNRLFGAESHDVPWDGDRNGAIGALCEELKDAGKRPYLVPYGVSSPLGAVGYASAIDEIFTQLRELGFRPTAIVHCSDSATTQAGFIVRAVAERQRHRIYPYRQRARAFRLRQRPGLVSYRVATRTPEPTKIEPVTLQSHRVTLSEERKRRARAASSTQTP